MISRRTSFRIRSESSPQTDRLNQVPSWEFRNRRKSFTARQLARILWNFTYLCWANPIFWKMTAPSKLLNESPATPTAGPRNFMIVAVRRFCSRTWKESDTKRQKRISGVGELFRKIGRRQRIEFFVASLAEVPQEVQRAVFDHPAQLWQGLVR